MSASTTLTSFTSDPGAAIAAMPPDGLLITRPDGPALRLQPADATAPADRGDLSGLARAALAAVPPAVFADLVQEQYPFFAALPPAALRPARAELEAVHASGDLAALDAVVGAWRERAVPFLRPAAS